MMTYSWMVSINDDISDNHATPIRTGTGRVDLTLPSMRGIMTGMSDGWPRMLSADRAALRSPELPRRISTAKRDTSRSGHVPSRLVLFKYCDGKRAPADVRSMLASRKNDASETMAVWRRSGSFLTTSKSSIDWITREMFVFAKR